MIIDTYEQCTTERVEIFFPPPNLISPWWNTLHLSIQALEQIGAIVHKGTARIDNEADPNPERSYIVTISHHYNKYPTVNEIDRYADILIRMFHEERASST